MKLATLKNGKRDGRLVVVSRDLTLYTDASFLVPTLQAALDDWQRIAPHLATLAESLETGAVPSARFHEHDAMPPLPRPYNYLACDPDGLRLSGAAPGAIGGPRDPIVGNGGTLDASACVVLVLDDVEAGASADAADSQVRLVMLGTAFRNEAGAALSTTFSPVAVTPDDVRGVWSGQNTDRPISVSLNGKSMEPNGSASQAPGGLISEAVGSTPLGAGTLIALRARAGSVSVAEGDTIRVEMKDDAGHSIFGAIERTFQA
jgi:fumarylacetoacetate (FAA) hydrolase